MSAMVYSKISVHDDDDHHSDEVENLVDRGDKTSIEVVYPDSTSRGFSCLQIIILFGLMAQTTFFILLRRYSQAVLEETYSFGSVLVVGEVVKLATAVVAIGIGAGVDDDQTPLPLLKALRRNLRTILPMCIPAIIYLIMNLLSFYAIARVDAGTFSIVFQLKIVTTAVFARLILAKQFPWRQHRALLILVLAVIQITVATMPQEDCADSTKVESSNGDTDDIDFDMQTYLHGVMAVVVGVTLTGLCTVFMEKMFKEQGTGLTIWDRNFQLALASIPVYILIVYLRESGEKPFFHDWSWIAAALAVLNALGGILVAMTLKYTDSMLKTLASTGSVITTAILSWLILDGPMNSYVAIASVTVVVAGLSYQFE